MHDTNGLGNGPPVPSGRQFGSWMLGCGVVLGNCAWVAAPYSVAVLPAAWLAIVIGLSVYRTRRRLLIGVIGGISAIWPWIGYYVFDWTPWSYS